MKKFAVLGSGDVARVLAGGLKKHGYEVRMGARSPEKLKEFSAQSGIPVNPPGEAAAWAEGIFLAVLGRAATEALQGAGAANLRGKLVVDATNPISEGAPVDGVLSYYTDNNKSQMEELQERFPEARFVKAFNSVGSPLMVNPPFQGARPTMFYCGNDAQAKAAVAAVIDQFGWDGADMGTAAAARAIEPLCRLWCIPGFRQNEWRHAFHLLKV